MEILAELVLNCVGFAWTIQRKGGIDDETNGPSVEVMFDLIDDRQADYSGVGAV